MPAPFAPSEDQTVKPAFLTGRIGASSKVMNMSEICPIGTNTPCGRANPIAALAALKLAITRDPCENCGLAHAENANAEVHCDQRNSSARTAGGGPAMAL